MIIDRKQFVELLSIRSGLDAQDVNAQLDELIRQIEESTSKGKALEIKDFGAFQLDGAGTLHFIASEALQLEINHRYSGLEPIPRPASLTTIPSQQRDLDRETGSGSSATTTDGRANSEGDGVAGVAEGQDADARGGKSETGAHTERPKESEQAASKVFDGDIPSGYSSDSDHDSDLDFDLDEDVDSLKATPISSERMAALESGKEDPGAENSDPPKRPEKTSSKSPLDTKDASSGKKPLTEDSSESAVPMAQQSQNRSVRVTTADQPTRHNPQAIVDSIPKRPIASLIAAYGRNPVSFAVAVLSGFLILVSVILVGDHLFRTPMWKKEFIASTTFAHKEAGPNGDANATAAVGATDQATSQATDYAMNQAKGQATGNSINGDDDGGASGRSVATASMSVSGAAKREDSQVAATTPSTSNQSRTVQTNSSPTRYGLTGGFDEGLKDAYTIVLFSFSREQNAIDQMSTLKADGFRVTKKQVRSSSGVLWRVSVGQFRTETEAKDIALLLDEPYRSQHFISRQ